MFYPTTLSPTIERINVLRKNTRQKVAGSRKTKMPNNTAPTAPMPVQTGYAMPMGIVCVAFAKSTALSTYSAAKPEIHSQYSVPTASLVFPRQNVKPVSQRPAMIRIIQFMAAKVQKKPQPEGHGLMLLPL